MRHSNPRPRISRRSLLQGLGASTLALPFVPLLDAESAPGEIPRRLILFYTPDGVNTSSWLPTGGPRDFSLGTILSPLEDVRDDIIVFSGLRASIDGPGETHAQGMAGLWTGCPTLEGNQFDGGNGNFTGWGSGPSVDQILVQALKPDTPFASMQFGVQTGDPHVVSRNIYAGAEAPLHPEPDPYAVFEQLFAQIGLEQAELQRLRARKQSVLDVMQGRLSAIQDRVAAHDRHKIAAHLEAVRAIEQRLDADYAGCEAPEMGDQIDVDANENFPLVGDLQMRLMVSALACGVTRFASMQWSRGFSDVRHTWIGRGERHHGYSHGGPSAGNTDIDRWYAERFRDLIQLLASYPEGDGTLLDNTLIVWGREVYTPSSHLGMPFPLVLAGRAGGRIETGRFLDYGDTPHAALLVSMCNAMGLEDVTSVGTVNPDTGPLPGLVT